MAVITKPITIPGGALNAVLNCASGDVGTICTWGSINMWSKYKPFVHPAVAFADSAAHLAALRACNCGLSMPKYATPTACLEAAIALGIGGKAWTYNKPTGTIGVAPYRILDFDGYDHEMHAPFGFAINPSYAYQIDNPTMDDSASGGTANIFLEDLLGTPNLSSYKICLAWRKHGTTVVARAQAVDNTANWLASIDNDADYDVCAFLSPVDIAYTDAEARRDYYLCPVPLSTFHRSSQSGFQVDGDVTLGRLDGEFWAMNRSHTLQRIQVRSVNPTLSKDLYTTAHTVTTVHESFYLTGAFTQDTQFYMRFYISASSYVEQLFYPRFPL